MLEKKILGLTHTPSPIPCLSLIFNFQAGPHYLAELTLNLLSCTDRLQTRGAVASALSSRDSKDMRAHLA